MRDEESAALPRERVDDTQPHRAVPLVSDRQVGPSLSQVRRHGHGYRSMGSNRGFPGRSPHLRTVGAEFAPPVGVETRPSGKDLPLGFGRAPAALPSDRPQLVRRRAATNSAPSHCHIDSEHQPLAEEGRAAQTVSLTPIQPREHPVADALDQEPQRPTNEQEHRQHPFAARDQQDIADPPACGVERLRPLCSRVRSGRM